jgi:hypothetical protein
MIQPTSVSVWSCVAIFTELGTARLLVFALPLARSRAEPLRACAFVPFICPKISRFCLRGPSFSRSLSNLRTFALPVSFRARTYIQAGQERRNRETAGNEGHVDGQNRMGTGRTVQTKHDRTEEQESQNGTGGTGLPDKNHVYRLWNQEHTSCSRPLLFPLPGGLGSGNGFPVMCVTGRKKREFAPFSFALGAIEFSRARFSSRSLLCFLLAKANTCILIHMHSTYNVYYVLLLVQYSCKGWCTDVQST